MFNKDNFKDKSTLVYPRQDKFYIGMEIEFMCGRGRATEYNKLVGTNRFNNILGYDGSGMATKEFRSPVFTSEKSNAALTEMETFVAEVQEFLVKEFKATFIPWKNSRPMGIHFSISGLFRKDIEILQRCKIIQPKLRNLIDPHYLDEFDNRECRYSGNISSRINSFTHAGDYCNAIRDKSDGITEFRFIPSCDVLTFFPYLDFIILGRKEPNNRIKFIS